MIYLLIEDFMTRDLKVYNFFHMLDMNEDDEVDEETAKQWNGKQFQVVLFPWHITFRNIWNNIVCSLLLILFISRTLTSVIDSDEMLTPGQAE